jgi:hypothetical protein
MRVEARGYLRSSGIKVIFDGDITEAVVTENGISAGPNTLSLERSKSDGSIKMRLGPIALSGFGGNYNVFVQLTKDEIVKLFLEDHPEVREVIDRLPPRKLDPGTDIDTFLHPGKN